MRRFGLWYILSAVEAIEPTKHIVRSWLFLNQES